MIFSGLITVPGAAGGNLAMGIFIKCFDLRVRGMLRLATITCAMVGILAFVSLVRCESTFLAGFSVSYSDST